MQRCVNFRCLHLFERGMARNNSGGLPAVCRCSIADSLLSRQRWQVQAQGMFGMLASSPFFACCVVEGDRLKASSISASNVITSFVTESTPKNHQSVVGYVRASRRPRDGFAAAT